MISRSPNCRSFRAVSRYPPLALRLERELAPAIAEQMVSVQRWGAVAVQVLSGALGCNPFDAFAECDDNNIRLEDVAVDVESASEASLGDYTGTLTWTLTQRATSVFVRVARSDEKPISPNTDCDGNLDGFTVPLRVLVESDDGLVALNREHTLALDAVGAFKSISPPAIVGPVSFEALKAQGLTPSGWVSNFSPSLRLPLEVPGLTPQSGVVAAETGPRENRSIFVLGELQFQ